ncbi:MAG: hypothetical protein IJT31_08270, partial [Oscillibacter sp.]|nr:hypothetical protein [Oscillibacter sp.]
MKRYILAILSLCLSVSLCACGATPAKSAPAAPVGDEPAPEEVYETPDAETEIPELGTELETEIPELGAETEIPEPGAELEAEVPDSDSAAPADFSTLAGTWHADESGTILTIYGNGGFELTQAEDTYEGS